MAVAAAAENYFSWGNVLTEVTCIAGVAMLTSVAPVPCFIFSVSKAIFNEIAKEGSRRLFGPDRTLSSTTKMITDIACFVLPILGGVGLTALAGFPITVGMGCLLALAAAIARIVAVCFGVLCLGSLASCSVLEL